MLVPAKRWLWRWPLDLILVFLFFIYLVYNFQKDQCLAVNVEG